MPEVTVAIASYNHEAFVKECIESVLKQTFQDFEIVVTDDGSSDSTASVVAQIGDPRLTLERFPNNRGACVAINNSIRKARGKYIAILNSDDSWELDKLGKQVEFMDARQEVGAAFSRVTFIDDSGAPIPDSLNAHAHTFDARNRSRSAWLNHFFRSGNCLCHPSILIRRECYDEVGLYNERMANLPDLDMWVRLCLKHEIFVSSERLVRFRLRKGEANASGNRVPNNVRILFEYKQILDHYLAIHDSQAFKEVFPEAAKYGQVRAELMPYFLGRMALDVPNNAWKLWGMETIFRLMGNAENARLLEAEVGFAFKDLYRLAASTDVFGVAGQMTEYPVGRFAGLSLYVNPGSKLGRLGASVRRMSDRIRRA
jgi:glycosyltransferase involved in cell wall biosynthesis